MELIYLWVENFRNINKVGFSFSSKFDVNFVFNEKLNYSELQISDKKDGLKFFENNITNVTALIGKNGSGKTNILDLLGMRMRERKDQDEVRYFIFYHDEGNKFLIEGGSFELIKDNILNYPDERPNFVSEPYSMEVIKKDTKFEFKRFMGSSESRVNYFNFRNFFKTGYNRNSFTKEKDYSCFFNRINLNPNFIGIYPKYKLIIDFNKISYQDSSNKKLFNLKNNTYLIINNNIRSSSFESDKLNLKINTRESFFDKKSKRFKPINTDKKNRFILNLIEDYIKYSFSSLIEMDKTGGAQINELKKSIETIEYNDKEDSIKYLLSVLKKITKLISIEIDGNNKEDSFYISFERLINLIEKVDKEFFRGNKIIFPIGVTENNELKNLLSLIDYYYLEELNYLNHVLEIKIEPMSSGEDAFINIFASLYFGIRLLNYGNKENAIILLDEPDIFMHPEWSRIMLSEIFSLLNSIEGGYKAYQIIVSTHSPFIISDLPSNNVIALEKCNNTGDCLITSIENTEQTFASNIHTLFSNKFFMETTTGEFAKTKINTVIGKLLDKSYVLSDNDKEEIEFLINIIGEPLLRNKIKEMYLHVLPNDFKKELYKKEIERLQNELNLLE